MDNLLQELVKSIKGAMAHYRNNPEDKNLCLVACAIRNVITDNSRDNSKILVQVLEENIQVFERLGYCIESFGGNEYILNGVPAQLPDIATQELFIEIIDGLASNKNDTTPGTLLERVATMSCKAAVKGGSRLDERQAQELLKELMQLENPYNCPHGHPVMVKITQRELETKFKRII